MMKNIYLVVSPFQLICAIEARKKYCGGEKNYLFIMCKGSDASQGNIQIRSLIDDQWEKVVWLKEIGRRGFFRSIYRIVLTVNIALIVGLIRGNVFIGDYRVSWFRLIGRIYGKKTIILDDGASTIPLLSRLESNNFKDLNSGMDEIFTIFDDGRLERLSNNFIVRNNLNELSLQKNKTQIINPKKIYIVGQWLSESGVISLNSELEILNKILKKFSSSDLKYIPHRHESFDKLKKIEVNGFCVCIVPKPLEYYLMDSVELPAIIVSWYSTALFVINKLFPEIKVISVRPTFSSGTASDERLHEIGKVYDYLKFLGIETIDAESEFKTSIDANL